ncbi:MAG: metallophosphoesterase [Firmicutes bacterium]|nr:metallophosphoesterase [Bacillota bacterium]
MEVFAISDWHLSINCPKPMDIFGGAWENYIEELTKNLNATLHDDSILLIAGDISWAMQLNEALPDLDFIANFKGKKIILRGNHDYWWKSISGVRNSLKVGVYALQNDSIKIGNVVIAGSRGWVFPENENDKENQTIFDREVIRLKLSLEDANKKRGIGDKLIVMTHYPPFASGKTTAMTDVIANAKADVVVYGHIHGKHHKTSAVIKINDIPYYLTSCDFLKNMPLKII